MEAYYAAVPLLFLDQLLLAIVVWIAIPLLGIRDSGDPNKAPLNDTAAKHVALFPYPSARMIMKGWPGILIGAAAMSCWIILRLIVASAIAYA